MKKNRKTNFKAYLEKIRFKYKVSILNENTLAETFSIRLSRLNVWLVAGFFLLLTFFVNSVIIIKTPLKHFLPGYEEVDTRAKFIQTAIKVDSLSDRVVQQDEYIELMRNLLAGNIKAEEITPLDSIALKKREELLMVKSKREKEFIEAFEKEEQYNITSVELSKNQNAVVFFKPAKGIIANRYNPVKSHLGVDIITAPQENVVSVLDGTVVMTEFTISDGYIIGMQHADNMMSIYKSLSSLTKKTGESVRAGEMIAFSGRSTHTDTPTSQSPVLHFELWQKGKPLNPEEYIIF